MATQRMAAAYKTKPRSGLLFRESAELRHAMVCLWHYKLTWSSMSGM